MQFLNNYGLRDVCETLYSITEPVNNTSDLVHNIPPWRIAQSVIIGKQVARVHDLSSDRKWLRLVSRLSPLHRYIHRVREILVYSIIIVLEKRKTKNNHENSVTVVPRKWIKRLFHIELADGKLDRYEYHKQYGWTQPPVFLL